MRYIQFFQKSALDDSLIEACGDRAVVIVDARLAVWRALLVGESECKRRGYLAWQIFEGKSFTDSIAISHLNSHV